MAGKSKRGFAFMDAEKQRWIASKGGQAAHAKGTAHEFTPEEAREAGRKGGEAVSRNREHMAEIGRKGGMSSTGGSQSPHKNGRTRQHEGERTHYEGTAQNATDLLRADHDKVDALFQQYEMANGEAREKQALGEQICMELEVHSKLEEEIFYPAVRAKAGEEEKERVAEGLKEHDKIKGLIGQLKGLSSEQAIYDSIVRQLKECVTHHVQEEESEMLPQAEEQFGGELERLGTEMQQRKQQLMTSMPAGTQQEQAYGTV